MQHHPSPASDRSPVGSQTRRLAAQRGGVGSVCGAALVRVGLRGVLRAGGSCSPMSTACTRRKGRAESGGPAT